MHPSEDVRVLGERALGHLCQFAPDGSGVLVAGGGRGLGGWLRLHAPDRTCH